MDGIDYYYCKKIQILTVYACSREGEKGSQSVNQSVDHSIRTDNGDGDGKEVF